MRRITKAWIAIGVCSFLCLQMPFGSQAVTSSRSFGRASVQDDTVPLNFGQTLRGSIPAPGGDGCPLGSTQYTFDIEEGDCEPVGLGLSSLLTGIGNQDVNLYARRGQRVAIEDGKVIADHISESGRNRESLMIDFFHSPPLQAGTYYFAVSNCGPGAADYELFFTGSIIDFFSPVALITRVEIKGPELLMYGCYPQESARLYLNGKRQGHTAHDDQRPHGLVLAKKAGDKIAPGETVKLTLRFKNGIVSNKFRFTRPIE